MVICFISFRDLLVCHFIFPSSYLPWLPQSVTSFILFLTQNFLILLPLFFWSVICPCSKSSRTLTFTLLCTSYRNMEGENDKKSLIEEFQRNTVLPLFQWSDKRFAEREWFIGDKVRRLIKAGDEAIRIRLTYNWIFFYLSIP